MIKSNHCMHLKMVFRRPQLLYLAILEIGVGKKDFSDLSPFDAQKLNKRPGRFAEPLRRAFAEASALM